MNADKSIISNSRAEICSPLRFRKDVNEESFDDLFDEKVSGFIGPKKLKSKDPGSESTKPVNQPLIRKHFINGTNY